MLLKQLQYNNAKKMDVHKQDSIFGNFVPKEQRDARQQQTRTANFTLGYTDPVFKSTSHTQFSMVAPPSTEAKNETEKLVKAARQSHFSISAQTKPVFYQETSAKSAYTQE